MVKETDVIRATAPKLSRHKFTADRSDMAHRIKLANKPDTVQTKEPPSGR